MGLFERALAFERSVIQNKPLEDGRLKTDIDRLYYLIRSTGSIPLHIASKNLGIDIESVKEYSSILADQKLIIIDRPLIGDAVLRASAPPKDAAPTT